MGGLMSSCGIIKGKGGNLSKSQIRDKISSKLVGKPKSKNDYFLFNPDTFGWDKDLDRDLGFDSLDIVEFIIELENIFSISIKDADAEKITTPRQGVDLVYKYLKVSGKTVNE